MKILTIALVLALPIAFGACTSDQPTDQQQPEQPAQPDGDGAKTVGKAVVHDVKCGCSIDSVGKCGNYIMIDGNYVPMIHPKLGKMEWCALKDKGAKVETVGELKDGKFVAVSWKTVE
ncbi:MAG: hypothetical protein KAI24_04075 [Planctomycetes bacterium]|nr:hypothetical protein [Planctomycetota bacterium]